ncbi:MAG: hypothetical protein ACRC06_05625, partial [Waterburya sp.]
GTSLPTAMGKVFGESSTQILHQYKKTKLWRLDNQFNTLFPLTFPLYPNTTVKLCGRCKISVQAPFKHLPPLFRNFDQIDPTYSAIALS